MNGATTMTDSTEGEADAADKSDGKPADKPDGKSSAIAVADKDTSTGNVTLTVSKENLRRWAVSAVLLILAVTFAALYASARHTLSTQDAAAADTARAEKIATEYASGAATIQYQDIDAWLARLKTNTTPQLANKFETTTPKLKEVLAPLKWTSTATPLGAVVTTATDGVYKVNVFLTVNSTSTQTPDGGRTTVTYNVTVDQNNDWKITDVGGVDSALPGK
jgi:Mce-associated membrane protein